jgi:hypothetical protein
MVCGFLAVQDFSKNPLLSALPRLFKVGIRESSGEWLESALRFATEQAASENAGGATVLAKLSELVFVEAMRRYVETMPGDCKGWLAGLRDRFVAQALALMHARPAHPWRWPIWPARSGCRARRFAQRFNDLLGVPPIAVPRAMAAAACRAATSRRQPTACRHSGGRGLRLRGGIQSRVQARIRRTAGDVAQERGRPTQLATIAALKPALPHGRMAAPKPALLHEQDSCTEAGAAPREG